MLQKEVGFIVMRDIQNQRDLFSLLTNQQTSVFSLENSQASSFSCSSSLVLMRLSSRPKSTPSSVAGSVLFRVSICMSQKSTSFSTYKPIGLDTSCWMASVSASMSGTTMTFSLAASQNASFFFSATWFVLIFTFYFEKPHPWLILPDFKQLLPRDQNQNGRINVLLWLPALQLIQERSEALVIKKQKYQLFFH